MLRKAIIPFSFLILISNFSFADTASDLKQIETSISSGQFTQARQICNSITQNNPGTDLALKAQAKLTAIYVMTNQFPQADAEIARLANDYKTNAELPAVLYGISLRLKSVRELQRAQNLSQQIIQQFPTSEQAQRIQLDTDKELALKNIAEGKFADAETAVNNLISTSSTNPAMPATLFKIAREFKEADRNDETLRVYEKIANDYPNSDFGPKARLAVDKMKIWKLIKAGDITNAQTALQQLITTYAGHDDLPHTLHGIALKFEENGFYPNAKALYQYVIQTFPEDKMAEIAVLDSAKSDIRAMTASSSFAIVTQQLNSLKTAFADNPHLPKAVYQIGEQYYKLASHAEQQGDKPAAEILYSNAAHVFNIVINHLPSSSSTPLACDYAAICYAKTSNLPQANQCYQKIIDNYPAYRLRWNAIYMTARNCESMRRSGTMPYAEADSKISSCYQKLLTEYPDCKVADYARKQLGI